MQNQTGREVSPAAQAAEAAALGRRTGPLDIFNETGGPADFSKEAQGETGALMAGAMQGLRNFALGPVQAGLELVAPQVAKGLTDRVNQMDAPFEQVSQDHPYAHGAGEMIGTTVALMGASKLLGGLMVPLAMARTVGLAVRSAPAALRMMGVGAALGATSFNKDPDSASRLGEAALGAGLGLLGQQVGKAVSGVIRNVADKAVVQNFLGLLQRNLDGFEPSLSGVKSAVLDRYKTMTDFRNRLYATRDASGRTIEGYPSGFMVEGGKAQVGGVAGTLSEAMAGKIGRDEVSGLVKGTARELDKTLGLTEQREALALWEQRQQEYEKALAKWQEMKVPGMPASATTEIKAQILQRMSNSGAIPEMPKAPPMFEPQPIPAGAMAEGRRVVNRAISRSRDQQTRTQLGMLKRNLEQTASQTAREAGVDVATYERRQAQADLFNREKIVPLQRLLGGRNLAEAQSQITPAEMYEAVVKSVKTKDKDAQKALYDLLGPKGREEARKAVFNDMLSSAVADLKGTVDPKRIASYVQQHGSGLETLLGRDEFTNIRGIATIAQDMAAEQKARGLRGLLSHHPWLLSFAGIKAMEGNFHEAAMLGASVVGMEIIRSGLNGLQTIPRVMGPLLPRAARTVANSAELKQIMRSVDVAMNTAAKVTARELPQATGGQPATAALGVVGELGQAAGNVVGLGR